MQDTCGVMSDACRHDGGFERELIQRPRNKWRPGSERADRRVRHQNMIRRHCGTACGVELANQQVTGDAVCNDVNATTRSWSPLISGPPYQFPFESTVRPASDITPQVSNVTVDVVIPLTGDEGQYFIACTGEFLPGWHYVS